MLPPFSSKSDKFCFFFFHSVSAECKMCCELISKMIAAIVMVVGRVVACA